MIKVLSFICFYMSLLLPLFCFFFFASSFCSICWLFYKEFVLRFWACRSPIENRCCSSFLSMTFGHFHCACRMLRFCLCIHIVCNVVCFFSRHFVSVNVFLQLFSICLLLVPSSTLLCFTRKAIFMRVSQAHAK